MNRQNLLNLLLIVGLLVTSQAVYGQDYEVDTSFNPQFDFARINTFEFIVMEKALQ